MYQIAIVFLCLIILIYWYVHSTYNTTSVTVCNNDNCEDFKVSRIYKDKNQAAKIMNKISKNVTKLTEHLQNKYMTRYNAEINPTKNNKIDILNGTEMYSVYDENISNKEYLQERINQLLSRYDNNEMYEISPLNASGSTSYTEDKKTLILCLRSKTPDANGNYKLHDINIIMFVVIHELAHMMNDEWGHEKDFWKLFKFMLKNAIECGVYTPVDYRNYPLEYCGLNVSYNPLYDKSV